MRGFLALIVVLGFMAVCATVLGGLVGLAQVAADVVAGWLA